MKIVFSRYGREARSRCELRSFANIVPVDWNTISKVENVNKTLSLFKRGSLLNKSWSDSIKGYGSCTIGTLLPVIRSDGLSLSKEFRQFATAVLRNPTINFLLNKNRNLPTLLSIVENQSLLNWICNSASQSKTRASLFMWAEEHKNNLATLLYTVQVIKAAVRKRMVESTMKNIKFKVDNRSDVSFDVFSDWYVDGLFESASLLKRRSEISSTARTFGPAYHTFIASINVVRDTYLTHKPKHI